MKPLFVISLDALGFCDEDIYKNLPFFSKMIEKGTWIRRLESVYPTLTYAIHSSIVTGRYPVNHGVDNNLRLQPERSAMDWHWDESDIREDTIFRNAKKKGMTIAAFSWPVTGGMDAEYNIPEVWTFENETYVEHLKNQGSRELIEEVIEEFGQPDRNNSQKVKDKWHADAASYTFNKYRPDITFIHLIDVDHQKHILGPNHFGTYDSIRILDELLEEMFTNISKNYDLDDINIMLLSDHSQLETAYPIRLNKVLADMNLVNVKEDGTVKEDWKAYFLTCGGSTALYTKEDDENLVKEIREKIESLNIKGIDKIFDKDQIRNEVKSSDKAVLWIEAKEGYHFDPNALDFIELEDFIGGAKGNHGFLPSKEKNLAMGIFKGPAFKKGHIIENEKMVDIAPTINKIYDLGMKDMDGDIIDCLN